MNKKVISFAAAMMLAALPLAAGSAAGFTAGEYEAFRIQGFGGPVDRQGDGRCGHRDRG